jgi:CheY-like chemotaxis protein
MPQVSGIDVIKEISSIKFIKPLAVITLSSIDLNLEEASNNNLRVDTCLIKPVIKTELIKAIKEIVSKKILYDRAVKEDLNNSLDTKLKEHSSTSTQLHNKEVLIVEDNEESLETVIMLLKMNNISFDYASDGAKAIELTKLSKYKLILMDIQLPEIDGMEAMKQIKNDSENLNNVTYIIATTAYAMAGDQEKYLQIGFDNYISKPYDLKVFQNIVNDVIANHTKGGNENV